MRVAFFIRMCVVNSYETEKMKINFEKRVMMVVAFEEKGGCIYHKHMYCN